MTDLTKNPQAQVLAEQAEGIFNDVQKYTITDIEIYNTAADHLKTIKGKTKEIDDARKSMTKPLDESKKKIMDFFRKPLEQLKLAEGKIKGAMLDFKREQERKRQEEEARLRALAEKEAEKERKKLEKKAEKAEAKGDTEKAEELREQKEEVFAPTPIVESKVNKVSGISTKKVWKYRIVDETKIPHEYMMPNEKKIGQFARMAQGTQQVPGIEFYAEETLASTAT